MKKQLFIILNVLIILITCGCDQKKEILNLEKYIDKNYSLCINENEQINIRINKLIDENMTFLEPLKISDPKLESQNFVMNFMLK